MNMDLMTINNTMFTGTAVAPPPAAKPNTFTNDTNFSSSADNIQPYYNTHESTMADNMPAIDQNKPINEPREDFNQTLRKTVKADSPDQNQNNKKPDKDEPASAIPSKKNTAQSFSATEIPLILGLLVKENSTKIEPKTGHQLAQLIANLKDGKSSTVTGQPTKSAETKLLVNIEKGQTTLKSSLPNTSKDQPALQTVLPNIPEGTPTADIQHGEGKKTAKILVSNGTTLTTKAITNKENAKELLPDAFAGANNKTTEINEKLPPVDTAVIVGNTKNSDVSNQKPGLDTLVEDGGKKTEEDKTLTDKPAIHTNEKTAELKTKFSQVQNKIIEPKSQAVGITPEKSTTTHNSITNSEILSESSNENSKKSQPTGSKLPDNSAVQVSTSQTKNNNNAATNNNPNSEFQQIITHSNPENPATELIPNSAEGTKTVDLPNQTSPGSIYASVGQQIQESVQRSFSQEGQNQQITIQLNPPELGKVLIKFQEQDNQISGLLEVSKTQTRIEIEQAIPQIIRGLQDSGIQIKRLDVTISQGDQPDQGILRDSASGGLQNGWNQHQDSTDTYMGRNNLDASEINEWLKNNNSYQNISELQETLSTDGSINMLI